MPRPMPRSTTAVARIRPVPAVWVLGLALALVVSVLGGLIAPASAQAATYPSVTSAEKGFVSKINASRSSRGYRKLTVRSDLTTVARNWAKRMASSKTLRHNPNLSSQVRGWHYVGENVGVGGSVSQLHTAFMNSPGHRANVLHSRYTEVGIGVAYGGGRMWVVEVFRRPW
ncbi:MAG: CAP domain-containing protein [Angustibacter sp.]